MIERAPHRGYFDHAATTPVRPEVIEAMVPLLGAGAANATGTHRAARAARRAVDDAREDLAELLGVDPARVVFTSGGTESDNLAVLGGVEARPGSVVCSAIEHPAVLVPARVLGAHEVGVDHDGLIDLVQLDSQLDALARAGEAVTVVSVMTVNNEVGAVQPLRDVAEIVRERAPGATLHTDAVQALPWLDLRAVGPLVDSLSLSAHKFGGPQGVGMLVVEPSRPPAARHLGGGQERERRSGTHNVAGIVGMAVAARLADECRDLESERIGKLRDRLLDGLVASIDDAHESGDRAVTSPGTAHLCIGGVENEALLFLLDEAGLAASAASSCASGAQDPSHVLAAMGIARELSSGSLRLSLGWTTDDADVDLALAVVPAAVARLRELGS